MNEQRFDCPPEVAFHYARRVDLWPRLLPHYRWVRFHQGGPEAGGVVEMAARREFDRLGRLGWPVWWQSQMWVDPQRRQVHYRHIAGVTRGMEVCWEVQPAGAGSQVSIWHRWAEGPRFAGLLAPRVGRGLIGPYFVQAIAQRTLQHLAQHAAKAVAL